jgi:hypothetical protein
MVDRSLVDDTLPLASSNLRSRGFVAYRSLHLYRTETYSTGTVLPSSRHLPPAPGSRLARSQQFGQREAPPNDLRMLTSRYPSWGERKGTHARRRNLRTVLATRLRDVRPRSVVSLLDLSVAPLHHIPVDQPDLDLVGLITKDPDFVARVVLHWAPAALVHCT